MMQQFLVTLSNGAIRRTLAFDGTSQSVTWLGIDLPITPDNSIARLESVRGGVRLLVANGFEITQPIKADSINIDDSDSKVILITRVDNSNETRLYIRKSVPELRRFRKIGYTKDTVETIIGRSSENEFVYNNKYVSKKHAKLSYIKGNISIIDVNSTYGTVVNGQFITPNQPRFLEPGDVVEILDLVIGIGSGFITINNPIEFKIAKTAGLGLMTHGAIRDAMPDVEETEKEPDLFYPAPRLSKSVHPLKLAVDDPPAKKPEEDQPVILQIGPSFLMGLSSVFMAMSSFTRMAEGAGLLVVAPSITMAIAMIAGSIIWPIIARSYARKRDERNEVRRGRLYVSYLDSIENKLADESELQAEILNENRRPVSELIDRAVSLSPLLMNHTSAHRDFMDLRVGIGDDDIAAEVTWPSRHFSLADDRMLDMVDELSKKPPELRNIPLAFNPAKHFIAGILGEREFAWDFMRGLLAQVCTLYSYQDVKIVMVSDEEEMPEWEFLTFTGHLYDSTAEHRYVGLSVSGMIEEDLLLEKELERRTKQNAEVLGDYGVYYIIVCANQQLAKRSEAIARLLKLRSNRGFSLIYIGKEISDLPRECGYIVDLYQKPVRNLGISLDTTAREGMRTARRARMFARSDVQGTLREFDPDIMVSREQAHKLALSLARIRLDIPEQRVAIPDSLGFLEMYEIGNVTHLNVGQRWALNDASQTLEAPLGISADGEQTVLNLHEKIHGPHGLIAGTTGSGKSELIITYILSMCVNYAPDEVEFVLIDYKGGGLAGAFENEHHHLPHLAGTITNLDGGAIQRSLVSIRSELKRRQDLFNQARDATGESTLDIYKYLSFYRQGILHEPLPHLFIVADEFAELKQQEPEFMKELISAARIGRSLGVHLILATQKPSGVVDDQIWSNARFKISLKVSDAADSNEMIRTDDAARITQPGRYYMLVGYNESYSQGQSAYSGAPYSPKDAYQRRKDNAVELLDAEGAILTRLRPTTSRQQTSESELNAVLTQIEEASHLVGKQAKRIWLDPLPRRILLSTLQDRYGGIKPKGFVCLAGEVDDPENQKQDALWIDIVESGNVLLYGSQNSGVDELLKAMIVSLASRYSSRDLWVYGIDFGTGSLSELTCLPHLGGVVLTGNTEALESLMRTMSKEIQSRRTKLLANGGSIEEYNRRFSNENQHIPRIIVAINNLASLQELNEDISDALVALTLDGPRYGIHFIVTAPTAITPKYKLRSNFGVEIPTILNDKSEYSSILGNLNGIVPPHREQGGLVKIGKRILEFQGVSLADSKDNAQEVINSLASKSISRCSITAAPIPVLPKRVTYKHFGEFRSERTIPVGLDKKDIIPVWFDTVRSPYMLVFGDDEEALCIYLRGLHEALSSQEPSNYRFIDPNNLLSETKDENVLRNEHDIVQFMQSVIEDQKEIALIVFTSIAQIISEQSSESASLVRQYIENEVAAGKTGIIAFSESWRISDASFDRWYKVLTSGGNGVWVGGGLAEQTLFRHASMSYQYRELAERSDGYYIMRGKITPVRLLESINDADLELS